MKKNLNLTVLLSLFIVLSCFSQIPTNGLIAYYPFNGNANDATGNGSNGTVIGATATSDRFGNLNSAYNFNGTSNYINLGKPTILNFLQSQNYSFILWFKTSNISEQRLLSKRSNYSGLEIVSSNDTILPFIGDKSNNFIWKYGSSDDITNDKWHFLCETINQQTKQITVYLDGKIQKTVDFSNVTGDITNTSNVIIGASSGLNSFFNGRIDDIRIYNREITSLEIAELYNENICFKTITVTDTLVINVNLTGFNPVEYQNNIKIYPNPTNNNITIDCGSNYNTLNGYTIKITNSISQTVYTSNVNKQISNIDLNSWTGKGIYFIYLIDGNSNTVDIKKIILQ